MRGADLLVATLANAGVNTIYTLSGNQIMPIFDACLDAGIRLIHVRHEAAAVYMAEAHAMITGTVGVALVTAAPGFGNALGPLYMARQAENPVLLLSGDSPLGQDGTGAFQELDQVAVSAPLTKYSYRPRAAAMLGSDTARAIRAAISGRPGPVHLALPFDVLNAEVATPSVPGIAQMRADAMPLGDDALTAIRQAFSAAERPVVITGPMLNSTRAGDLMVQLADALHAPVITMESPRGLNDPSLGRYGAMLERADVVLSLGKNIDFTTGFGKPLASADGGQVLLIDPDIKLLERARKALGARLTLTHQASARQAAQALCDQAGVRAQTDGRMAWRAQMAAALAERATQAAEASDGAMYPPAVCARAQQLLDDAQEAILVVDGGEFGQWAQALVSSPCRIINGPSGAIGGGICYALAAKIARPQATVVLLMGDGTAGFHFAEFETAQRYGANFIAIIGHDAKWNAEYQIQLRDYGQDRLIGCELSDARYDLAAAGLGCHGGYASDSGGLQAALTSAAASGQPACVVAKIIGLPAPSLTGSGH